MNIKTRSLRKSETRLATLAQVYSPKDPQGGKVILLAIGGICSTTGTGVYIALAGIPDGGQVTGAAVAITRLCDVEVSLFVTSFGFVPLFAAEILKS